MNAPSYFLWNKDGQMTPKLVLEDKNTLVHLPTFFLKNAMFRSSGLQRPRDAY